VRRGLAACLLFTALASPSMAADSLCFGTVNKGAHRDRPYLPRLFATPRGPYLQQHLSFMKAKPWVRHDEHYHVDFAVPCKL